MNGKLGKSTFLASSSPGIAVLLARGQWVGAAWSAWVTASTTAFTPTRVSARLYTARTANFTREKPATRFAIRAYRCATTIQPAALVWPGIVSCCPEQTAQQLEVSITPTKSVSRWVTIPCLTCSFPSVFLPFFHFPQVVVHVNPWGVTHKEIRIPVRKLCMTTMHCCVCWLPWRHAHWLRNEKRVCWCQEHHRVAFEVFKLKSMQSEKQPFLDVFAKLEGLKAPLIESSVTSLSQRENVRSPGLYIWMRRMAPSQACAFWCRFRRYRGNGGLAVVAVLFVMSRAFVRCEFRQDRTSGSWSVVSGKSLGVVFGFFWLVLALETVIFVFYNPNFTRVSSSFGCHCEQIGARCSQNSP